MAASSEAAIQSAEAINQLLDKDQASIEGSGRIKTSFLAVFSRV